MKNDLPPACILEKALTINCKSTLLALAVIGISYLMCGSSSSLLTMQRRSTFLSDGVAYAL